DLLADEPEHTAREHGRTDHAGAPRELGPASHLDRRQRGRRRCDLLLFHRARGVDTRCLPTTQARPAQPVPAAWTGGAAASGSVMRNVAPAPEPPPSTSSRPPCAVTIPWLMASPSPVPWPTSFVVKNGSKMRSRTSAGMPDPSSRNVTTACPS